jgi:hypothetical protein
VFGWGIGSYPGGFGAAHVHNDYLEMAYELGMVGLVIFMLSLASLPRVGAEYFAGAAFAVIALVSFPSHNPASAFLAAFLIGRLCGDRDLVLRRAHPFGDLFRRRRYRRPRADEGWGGACDGRVPIL